MIAWLKHITTPNEVASTRTKMLIGTGIGLTLLAYWATIASALTPTPLEVIQSFPALWFDRGLGVELLASFQTNIEALFWSIIISLPLAYLCMVPAIRPVSLGLAKMRFLTPIVFFTMFAEALHNGHQVKVGLLTLGETVFLITTMIGIVQAVPLYRFDDARTLRMSEWKATWYVVIRGTLHQAIDAIRDNAAMGWSMLMMVEANMRSEGGVGVLMMNNEKHLNFAELYMMAVAVVLVGIGQDAIIGQIRKAVCPYAH